MVAAITAAPGGAFLAKPGRDGLGGAPHLFAHNAVAVLAAFAPAHDADAAGWVVMRVPPAHASAVLEPLGMRVRRDLDTTVALAVDEEFDARAIGEDPHIDTCRRCAAVDGVMTVAAHAVARG